MRLSHVRLYANTLRYLKPIQLYYQIVHRLKRLVFRHKRYRPLHERIETVRLVLAQSLPTVQSYRGNSSFVFLNLEKKYDQSIDWNDVTFGKLWAYNLNYFDYLHQPEISSDEGLELIDSFIQNPHALSIGIEPYPISLRGINWIKFFSLRNIRNVEYDQLLFQHYQILFKNIEYHLMGNHLLENGFSLLFGAYYFGKPSFYQKASTIIQRQLREQILPDGGHFELSPMYHQIILFRILDCINLLQNNPRGDNLESVLSDVAKNMMAWLNEVTFSDGSVPPVNDSAIGIAPSAADLREYAERLGLTANKIALNQSGYRMIRFKKFELFIDVGNIGPHYIPGHAHSDTFNFLLYHQGRPHIVETGTSTYERNDVRLLERSTGSHNTVKINGLNQSEVWSSFRVGKRARIIQLSESGDGVLAVHDGYKRIGLLHERAWRWEADRILITDRIVGAHNGVHCIASLHFSSNLQVTLSNNEIIAGTIRIVITGCESLELENYFFSEGFNRRVRAVALRIRFRQTLSMSISPLTGNL